jgi:hypothetical protein
MARYGHIEWRTKVAYGPPYGHRLCQERQDIAPLATSFVARVPEIARAEPVNCAPNRVNDPNPPWKNDSKIGKIMPKS